MNKNSNFEAATKLNIACFTYPYKGLFGSSSAEVNILPKFAIKNLLHTNYILKFCYKVLWQYPKGKWAAVLFVKLNFSRARLLHI